MISWITTVYRFTKTVLSNCCRPIEAIAAKVIPSSSSPHVGTTPSPCNTLSGTLKTPICSGSVTIHASKLQPKERSPAMPLVINLQRRQLIDVVQPIPSLLFLIKPATPLARA